MREINVVGILILATALAVILPMLIQCLTVFGELSGIVQMIVR